MDPNDFCTSVKRLLGKSENVMHDFQDDHPVLSISGSLCILCSPFLCFFTPVVFFTRMFLVCVPAYLVTFISCLPFVWCCLLTWLCFSDLSPFASLDSVTLQLSRTVCCQSRPGTWSRALSWGHWSVCPPLPVCWISGNFTDCVSDLPFPLCDTQGWTGSKNQPWTYSLQAHHKSSRA